MPKGIWYLTHSTLFTLHDKLEGFSIQTVYEIAAHNSTTARGTAIKMRRRRRRRTLRLAARLGSGSRVSGPGEAVARLPPAGRAESVIGGFTSSADTPQP
jgi:hypothetical protein